MTKVTFVLPHNGSAGGVRVTVEMATQLIARGRDGRIAYYVDPFFSREYLLGLARTGLRQLQGSQNFDWLRGFSGQKQAFHSLDDLEFSKGEIVIAVGEYAVKYLYPLQRDVVKVRYCHCVFEHFSE